MVFEIIEVVILIIIYALPYEYDTIIRKYYFIMSILY